MTKTKRRLLTSVIGLMSGCAMADWVQISSDEEKNLGLYVDTATINKNGNEVSIWSLADFKETQTIVGNRFHSIEIQRQYDCRKEQSRTLHAVWYAGSMGGGTVVFSTNTATEWSLVTRETIAYAEWKFACNKVGHA